MAEVIAESLELKAEPIDVPLSERVDVLFLGGGVYKWEADPQLTAYLDKLDSQKIGQIIAFSTTGGTKTTIKRIRDYAAKSGIKINKKHRLTSVPEIKN